MQVLNIYKDRVYFYSMSLKHHTVLFSATNLLFQVEVVEGVAGEEDHHDEQEEHGEENAEAEGQHDEHDEDGILGCLYLLIDNITNSSPCCTGKIIFTHQNLFSLLHLLKPPTFPENILWMVSILQIKY